MGKEHFFLELEPPEERLRRAPHVVIIGGGFAGVRACKALANTEVRVTLIDKRNFNLFQPLLYQVATGPYLQRRCGHPSTPIGWQAIQCASSAR